ncbi:hypothetical protein BDN71DRAFT_1432675 [Pleurotus eryngii]|uniref:Uncharacterized protein n=1 Tax=Pleurotus eryngii TaxID=5323 RepID=A0A9P5ZSL9_PLEER|nr:hypothetical protein BDN71DRAFT_1432675 [Pleurotus eryngii]
MEGVVINEMGEQMEQGSKDEIGNGPKVKGKEPLKRHKKTNNMFNSHEAKALTSYMGTHELTTFTKKPGSAILGDDVIDKIVTSGIKLDSAEIFSRHVRWAYGFDSITAKPNKNKQVKKQQRWTWNPSPNKVKARAEKATFMAGMAGREGKDDFCSLLIQWELMDKILRIYIKQKLFSIKCEILKIQVKFLKNIFCFIHHLTFIILSWRAQVHISKAKVVCCLGIPSKVLESQCCVCICSTNQEEVLSRGCDIVEGSVWNICLEGALLHVLADVLDISRCVGTSILDLVDQFLKHKYNMLTIASHVQLQLEPQAL